MLSFLKRISRRMLGDEAETLQSLSNRCGRLERMLADSRMLTARMLIAHMKTRGLLPSVQDAEFKVFSQWGDDGIIQYLVHHLRIEPRRFIEFGVKTYQESNTRFLLCNDNWRGLVLDGSRAHINAIQRSDLYWQHELTAVAAFIDRSNVNDLFRQNGFIGDLGILSIDIDGNDYWIWEAIDVVDPVVVIIEYNSVFGGECAVTVPYVADFVRTKAHHSNLYFGASLKALCMLGERKGYQLVGCNSSGVNAYFVRKDRLGPLRPLTCRDAYVRSCFRESRDAQGQLSYLSGDARAAAIGNLYVYSLEEGRNVLIKELTT